MKKLFYIGLFGVLGVLLLAGCGSRRPPISVTWRISLLDDSSYVMQVTNRSNNETMVIHLNAKNKELGQHVSHTFKVAPGATEEIGILEAGWKFLPGETYSLRADGYTTAIKGTVPR